MKGRDGARAAARPGADRPPVRIEIEIAALRLHGFVPHERTRIAAALEAELGRLMEIWGVPPALAAGGELSSLPPARMSPATGASPEAVGREAASALYRSLGGRPALADPRGRNGA